MKLQHLSFVTIYQKDPGLLNRVFNVSTLNDLLKNIEAETAKHYDNVFSNTFETNYNLIGDLFEIFAECFFLLLQSDNRVGCFNYTPGNPLDDNGVDGYGIGIDGKPATVQIKYRGNPLEELKERDLKQFGFQSIVSYNVDKDTKQNMIVFTTASGLHWHTEDNVFLNRVRNINRKVISSIVDNNQCFWLGVKELLKNSEMFYFKK